MPIITVNIGERNPDAFQRAVRDLKSLRFDFDKGKKLWYKYTDPIHVPTLLETLRNAGLRGVVDK